MGCVQSELYSEGHDIVVSVPDSETLNEPLRTVKIVLLGARDTGKSTLLKQMRLVHRGDYTDAERESYTELVISESINCMREILNALPQLDITLHPSCAPHTQEILSTSVITPTLSGKLSIAIRSLLQDPGIKSAIERSNEFQLSDNASYFFQATDRLSHPHYLPTIRDILRISTSTTGITETRFTPFENIQYNVFDVGGPRSERKKWINCFENVDVIMFMVSLSEYDQALYEADSVNRMQESLTLFDSISNSRFFLKTPMILLLNKIDIFAEKLKHSPLIDYFPDYDGGDDYDAASQYICDRFTSLKQSGRSFYVFFTCAVDPAQIIYCLRAIDAIVLQSYMTDCNVI